MDVTFPGEGLFSYRFSLQEPLMQTGDDHFIWGEVYINGYLIWSRLYSLREGHVYWGEEHNEYAWPQDIKNKIDHALKLKAFW